LHTQRDQALFDESDMERKEKMGPFERATEVMEEWKSEFRARSVDELLAYGKQLVQPASYLEQRRRQTRHLNLMRTFLVKNDTKQG